jgi:hypothetical protein
VLVDHRSEKYEMRVSAEDGPIPSSMPLTDALSTVAAIAEDFAGAVRGWDLTLEFGIRLDPEDGAIVCGDEAWRHFSITCVVAPRVTDELEPAIGS